jgi:hypothetical protein
MTVWPGRASLYEGHHFTWCGIWCGRHGRNVSKSRRPPEQHRRSWIELSHPKEQQRLLFRRCAERAERLVCQASRPQTCAHPEHIGEVTGAGAAIPARICPHLVESDSGAISGAILFAGACSFWKTRRRFGLIFRCPGDLMI